MKSQLTMRKRDLGRVVFYAPVASELQWYVLRTSEVALKITDKGISKNQIQY